MEAVFRAGKCSDFSGTFLSEKMNFPQFLEVGIIVLGGHFRKYQVYNKDYEK
jgi:hypothetical protein